MRQLAILFRLAWRNLWRNHRRTGIMLGAVTVGVWAMMFLTALVRGMMDDMIEDGISALPGHAQAHHPEFLDDPSVANLVPGRASDIDAALAASGLDAWSTRVRVPAVVSSERETRGVQLIGVDPARETKLTFLDTDAIDGRFLDGPDDDGVVLGRKLVEELETDLGKRVVIMSQDRENDIADRGFRVVGVFDTELEAYEQAYAFTGKIPLQAMLGIGDRVSEVAVAGTDYRDVEDVYERLVAAVPAGTDVRRWQELDRYLDSMLRVHDGFLLVWVVVIFLALSFGLVNTLVMAVFERVREIGLMLALGMKPVSILGQIVFESMLLLTIGLAAGNTLAWLTIRPLAGGIDISIVGEGMAMFGAGSVLYPKLIADDVILSNLVVLVLGFLASLSPAWRASRLDPVEAITKVTG